ncbi:prostacyclin receptor [Trichoplusia ni]|uniref:Prostacyclin receptor n=1 Tax=Trichoplusia ni TaxID=7111 RepID=A0A7E5W645_TRINI|nr:prostacyclin receptor [Trichoplusia ni]XP_026736110.1 prostacyclin receptor [Trichoplusia ni]
MDFNSTLTSLVNATEMLNMTGVGAHAPPARHLSKVVSVLVKVVYAIGIVGNAAAIIALRRGERRVRNRKHLLLLTSLAANDLVALMGMMCAMLVGEHVAGVRTTRAYCATRVVLRVFGIGSVCIAVTMALERYLALTRPFLYQKQVTYYVIRTALLVSWFWAACLTCAPILGLGLYYDERSLQCTRYRNAETPTDLVYAAFYVAFGTVLCMVLVYCNLAVIRALYAITAPRGSQPVVRRVSKSSASRQRQRSVHSAGAGAAAQPPLHNAATAEEVAFSRLMATLSVLFMICWMPQMLTSALYLGLGPSAWARLAPLANLSDVLMLLNYVLNPILYVLMRQRRRLSLTNLCHSIAHCFKRSHKTSTESMSMKTSCCPQETLVVSDSSGAAAELRPLRPALSAHPSAHTLRIDD